MARREIPEINAGSMADIAFLLLIFFLVTTTMDKDKAYVRDIPKKVVVEIPPVPVEKRDICAIRANDKNQLLFRDQPMENPDDISEKIIEWFTANEKVNNGENNFPFYTHLTKQDIEKNLLAAEAELEEVENTPNVDDAMILFYESIVTEWAGRKQALALYGKSTLPEIFGQAHIRIEVQKGTHYELFAKIQSEIQEAIYELRDKAAMEVFNESYGLIERRFLADKNGQDKAKLDLLKILYPDRIIEVAPRR